MTQIRRDCRATLLTVLVTLLTAPVAYLSVTPPAEASTRACDVVGTKKADRIELLTLPHGSKSIRVCGFAGDDTVVVAKTFHGRVIVDGGSGVDVVSLAAWARPVRANLTTGSLRGAVEGS